MAKFPPSFLSILQGIDCVYDVPLSVFVFVVVVVVVVVVLTDKHHFVAVSNALLDSGCSCSW